MGKNNPLFVVVSRLLVGKKIKLFDWGSCCRGESIKPLWLRLGILWVKKNKPFVWETFWRRQTYCVFDFCFEKANARFFVASHLVLLLSPFSALSSLLPLLSCGAGGGSVGLARSCLLFSSYSWHGCFCCGLFSGRRWRSWIFSVLLATGEGCCCCALVGGVSCASPSLGSWVTCQLQLYLLLSNLRRTYLYKYLFRLLLDL